MRASDFTGISFPFVSFASFRPFASSALFLVLLFKYLRWTPYCSPFADKHTGDNIQEALDMDIEVKLEVPPTLPKCRKLSAHLHRADISRKLLEDECKVTDHYPKSVPTANHTR